MRALPFPPRAVLNSSMDMDNAVRDNEEDAVLAVAVIDFEALPITSLLSAIAGEVDDRDDDDDDDKDDDAVPS